MVQRYGRLRPVLEQFIMNLLSCKSWMGKQKVDVEKAAHNVKTIKYIVRADSHWDSRHVTVQTPGTSAHAPTVD